MVLKMNIQLRLAGKAAAFILLACLGTATAATDTAKLERELEARRVVIERDRKSLNADCNHISKDDTAKVAECKARHDDVMARMTQYKKDLQRYKILSGQKSGSIKTSKRKTSQAVSGATNKKKRPLRKSKDNKTDNSNEEKSPAEPVKSDDGPPPLPEN